MQSKVVAILETRTGAHLGELITRRGGIALLAPALAEVPDVEPERVAELLERWIAAPYGVVIFQTGVGTRALFATTDALGAADEFTRLLAQSLIVVRGPKPTGELTSRGIRIDLKAASPFTTETVLEALATRPLAGARVLVQRYGADNARLREALQERGASVDEIATYRWALPADTQPLKTFLEALAAARVDAVVFTSAVQIHNLFAVAESVHQAECLAEQLNGVIVASIGPVCSRALRERGVNPSLEAYPPKLGPLVAGLDAAFAAHPGGGASLRDHEFFDRELVYNSAFPKSGIEMEQQSAPNQPFLSDVKTLRDRARINIADGGVTSAYKGDVKKTIEILQAVLATEIICVLRYTMHAVAASGISSEGVKKEFKEHAKEESEHVDMVAERINQLGGKPDFNPTGLASRAASEYGTAEELVDMIKENLIAERIAVDHYSELIRYFGNDDPGTRTMLERILVVEEEHANDMQDLLAAHQG